MAKRTSGLTPLVALQYPHRLPDGRTVVRDYPPGFVVLKADDTVVFQPYDPPPKRKDGS